MNRFIAKSGHQLVTSRESRTLGLLYLLLVLAGTVPRPARLDGGAGAREEGVRGRHRFGSASRAETRRCGGGPPTATGTAGEQGAEPLVRPMPR